MATQENDRFFEISGFLYKLFPKVTFESGFEKREFVLEKHSTGRDDKVYKDLIKFEATKSWIGEMDKIGIGSEVKVYFTLGGKEWSPPDASEPKYINFLRAWKVEVKDNTSQDEPVQERTFVTTDGDDDDGLPF